MARQIDPQRPLPPSSTDLAEWALYYQTLAVEAGERRHREYLAWQAANEPDLHECGRWER